MIFEAGLATPNEVKGEACQRQNENVSSFKKIMKGIMVAQVAPVVKNPPANAGEAREETWVRETPWRRKWQPISLALVGKSHGQWSLELQSMGRHG